MKNYMLTGMAALLLSLLIPACQPDEPENIIFEETLEQTELGKDPNLAKLMSDFTGQQLNGRTEFSKVPFGTLDYNEVVVRIASEEQVQPNYTIRLIPPDSVENSLEYLVLIGEEEGYRGYIMQYQTSDEHVVNLHDPSKFTGHIRLLDFDRNPMSDNLFEDGQDLGSVSGGRSEATYNNCDCEITTERREVRYRIELNGYSHHGTKHKYVKVLDCTCNVPLTIDGSDAGGLGVAPPGQPVGSNPFGGGGSGTGGGSGSGGIEEPDNIGVITNPLPDDISDMLADEEFMDWVKEDPDVWDCFQELLAAGVYNVLRDAFDIKNIYSEIALVKAAILTACGDGESDPDNIHLMLDALGFVPVLGEGFDFVNGLLYLKEGDLMNAGFSFIAIVPVAGDAAGKGTKYVIKVFKVSEEVFDNAKRVITLVKSVPKETRKLLSSKLLKLEKSVRSKLAADILADPTLLDRIIINPIVVDSWKFTDEVLDNLKKDVQVKYELQGTGD